MKRYALYTLLVLILFTSGCAASTPAPELVLTAAPVQTPTPEPILSAAPVATSTPEAKVSFMPDLILEINNAPDVMKDPYGIALDSDGNMYVNDAGNGRVLVFDPSGTLIATWDKKGSGEGEFNSLGFGGIAIGKFILQFGSQGTDDGQFIRAIGIAVDSADNVYVTDDGNPFVQKFDSNGQFLMKWGGAGEGDGQFSHATGIAVDAQGNTFVADYENKRVQKFDPAGNFVVAWEMGEDLNVRSVPEAIAVDADGKVYVSDYALGRVQVFDNDGKFLWALSSENISKSLFKRPTGIALDSNGRIFIVNQAGNTVQVYKLPE